MDGSKGQEDHLLSHIHNLQEKKVSINALVDSDGVWIKDLGELATHVREGFMSLFTSNIEMGYKRP